MFQPGPDPGPPTPTGTLHYLALGDSYTIGESVATEARFPEQLADSLRNAGFDMADPRIIAKTGWTTDELQNGIDNAEGLRESYDLVSLLIGVNNQYRGRSVENYRPEFQALLEQAIDFAGGDKNKVFVVSIPDYAYTPFGNGSETISEGIDAYNAANKEIANALGVLYINITPISRDGLDIPDLVAEDNLHPSGEQYRRWVKLMLPEVKNLLQ